MTFLSSFRARAAGGAFLLAGLIPFAHAKTGPARPGDPRVRVTPADVAAANKKVAMAYGALMQMWSNEFKRVGESFTEPRIIRYDGSGYTACGRIGPSNALYCPRNNTIYYDQVFVAGMQKLAANAVGTDGDMAAVGIVAHEVGHAVAMQLGYWSRDSYENESTADCLAGAFALQSQRDGFLEAGDVDEAVFGMAMAGDPTPESTGNRRMDARIQARLARNSHGTREQRMQNFRDGLDGGAGACLRELR